MALSMTGFGESIQTQAGITCRIELRTVNNRHFKFSLKARDGFGRFESRIETTLRESIRRGTVQMSLDLNGSGELLGRRIDTDRLSAHLKQIQEFSKSHGLSAPDRVEGLLALPGIVQDAEPSNDMVESTWELVRCTLEEATAKLQSMRRVEGNAMTREMLAGCAAADQIVSQIAARGPEMLEEHRRRLTERVSRIVQEHRVILTDADLAREIALVADRTDVSEELIRLGSHLRQFEERLREDSPGRALEFLSQELAREANTIGSKSSDVAIATLVVDLKTQIERVRELVQNVE